ncbi:MAG: hypothetical protein NC124_17795 [Clostridium sp.]|nr:hypothetical protein [Clostridium sp.]
MFKRKVDPKLQEYWERRLDIKYNVEIEYYKKLCGIEYDSKVLRKNEKCDNTNLISYESWKNKVLSSIKNLSSGELIEYSRFLNQCERSNESKYGISQTLLIPFAIFLLGVGANVFNSLVDLGNTTIITILLFVGLIVYIFGKLLSTKEESIKKYFYQDMKEIVDEKIKQFLDNERAGD